MNLRSHWTLAKGGEVAMKTAQEAGRYRVLSTSNTLSGPWGWRSCGYAH